jgi:hypothetical protein
MTIFWLCPHAPIPVRRFDKISFLEPSWKFYFRTRWRDDPRPACRPRSTSLKLFIFPFSVPASLTPIVGFKIFVLEILLANPGFCMSDPIWCLPKECLLKCLFPKKIVLLTRNITFLKQMPYGLPSAKVRIINECFWHLATLFLLFKSGHKFLGELAFSTERTPV